MLEATLIGAGGSVVGGIVGGWFALVAARNQWKRDRADSREDRSHLAAMSIAESMASLDEALVAWTAQQMQSDLAGLRAAFNAFSKTAAVQSMALTDAALRQRVRAHVELLARVATLAEKSAAGGVALAEPARRHTEAVIGAFDAHCNGAASPPYQPPPLNDVAGLLAWQPVPAEPARKDDRHEVAPDTHRKS